MKLIIFSGFLGAGKTVAILSLADWLLRCPEGDRPSIVIIENEIGEVAYDRTLLESRGLAVKNLLSGCICCTLSTNLPEQLIDIRKQYDPDYIIVEPTGAAFPDRIRDAAAYADVKGSDVFIITIVDVTRIAKLRRVLPHLIESQIRNANVVLLSKTDLASEDEAEAVLGYVRAINADVPAENTPYGMANPEEAWKKVLENI